MDRLDPELCSVAGLLYDIWNYQEYDCPEHGELGAIEARKILIRLGNFSEEEIDLVCDAIAKHGDKLAVDGRHAELLKDADVFQHYLYNPQMYIEALSRAVSPDHPVKPAGFQRLERVLAELDLRSIN